MPCEESFSDARTHFEAAVLEGVSTLMDQCGYNRDRATAALMRELNRGMASRPSDHEIFATMKRYNLGIEEATKTLIISRAMKRALAENASPTEAIQHLTSKISLTNLLYESSDEDPSSDDDENNMSIRPELRVKPLASSDRSSPSHSKHSSARKSRNASRNSRTRQKTPTKGNTSGRKRSIDETVTHEKKEATAFHARARADSVTAEVDAKIAQKKTSDEPTTEIAKSASQRSKRVLRGDDVDGNMQTTSHKRMRATET